MVRRRPAKPQTRVRFPLSTPKAQAMLDTGDRRRALLYVAGRFMTVHIDKCGRARATRHRRKVARAQGTSSKRSSSDQDSSSREGGPARPQAASSRTAEPG